MGEKGTHCKGYIKALVGKLYKFHKIPFWLLITRHEEERKILAFRMKIENTLNG